MDYFLSLTNPLFYAVYVPVTGSAVLLFLVFYLTALLTQARKVSIIQPVSLPLWLDMMYPRWLDRLTVRMIVKAFAWGLGIAIISWIVLVVVFLAILVRV